MGAQVYVECALELNYQINTGSLIFDQLIHPTGSAGNQAGLVTSLESIHANFLVFGVSVRQPKQKQIDAVYSLVQENV